MCRVGVDKKELELVQFEHSGGIQTGHLLRLS
jgi:hypothetical protein